MITYLCDCPSQRGQRIGNQFQFTGQSYQILGPFKKYQFFGGTNRAIILISYVYLCLQGEQLIIGVKLESDKLSIGRKGRSEHRKRKEELQIENKNERIW